MVSEPMDMNGATSDPSTSTKPSQRQQIYGGIDPEVEENFHLVESVADGGIKNTTDRDRMLPATDEGYALSGQPRATGS
jgi:hypothetical protein